MKNLVEFIVANIFVGSIAEQAPSEQLNNKKNYPASAKDDFVRLFGRSLGKAQIKMPWRFFMKMLCSAWRRTTNKISSSEKAKYAADTNREADLEYSEDFIIHSSDAAADDGAKKIVSSPLSESRSLFANARKTWHYCEHKA